MITSHFVWRKIFSLEIFAQGFFCIFKRDYSMKNEVKLLVIRINNYLHENISFELSVESHSDW